MRKFMVAAGAAALLAASTFGALGAEATGAIKSIDMTAKTVTLEDGTIYVLPTGFDTASVKVGDKVKITFDEADGKMTATEVVPST
jgi:Cu/Ag efflux protein CusF